MLRAWVAVLSLLSMGPTCGNDIGEKSTGEPCTRTNDCASSLVCLGGTCASPDAGTGDAGADAGAGGDAGAADAG